MERKKGWREHQHSCRQPAVVTAVQDFKTITLLTCEHSHETGRPRRRASHVLASLTACYTTSTHGSGQSRFRGSNRRHCRLIGAITERASLSGGHQWHTRSPFFVSAMPRHPMHGRALRDKSAFMLLVGAEAINQGRVVSKNTHRHAQYVRSMSKH